MPRLDGVPRVPRRRSPYAFLLLLAGGAFAACSSAGGASTGGSEGAGGQGASAGSSQGGSAQAGEGQAGDGQGGDGQGGDGQGGDGGNAGIHLGGQSGSGGSVTPNACKTSCGPVELCDDDHLGYDDNCNGSVDEGCPCDPGQAHWCFKGDPANRFAGACQDGTERCTEIGKFSPCEGGKHALDGPDNCLNADVDCIDIKAVPFSKVKLAGGTAKFSQDADPNSESYAVACPGGVSNCPAVLNPNSAAASFQPLQSGEYGVTYHKTVNGVSKSCNYALFVGTSGMRVELSWDNVGVEAQQAGGAKGPDLDLHLHKPNSTTPWGLDKGSSDDCYFGNCRVQHFSGNEEPFGKKAVTWFSDASKPHNWTKSNDDSQNGCYSAPKGTGGQWKALGQGCHNPRLDLDTFACDITVTDPNDPQFCAPENINLDEVPSGSWFRVGVHYNATCSPKETHPVIRVYCNGGQVAALGSVIEAGQLKPSGFAEPITLKPDDCNKKFWVAADIYVKETECALQCTVKPVFSNPTTKAPYFLTPSLAESQFGPPYPSPPP